MHDAAEEGTLDHVAAVVEDAAAETSEMQKRKTDRLTAPDELPLADLVISTVDRNKAAGNGGQLGKKTDGEVHQEKEEEEKVLITRGPPIPISRRVQRKKLLVLDLNGLLADINQDYHNSHLSLGKVRGKLGKSRTSKIFLDFFLFFFFASH